MREKLLFVVGVVQALALLFHLALPRLAAWQLLLRDQPGSRAGYLELFNVHVAYTFGIFSVLSLAIRPERVVSEIVAWQGAAEALADPSLKPVVVRDELVPAR